MSIIRHEKPFLLRFYQKFRTPHKKFLLKAWELWGHVLRATIFATVKAPEKWLF